MAGKKKVTRKASTSAPSYTPSSDVEQALGEGDLFNKNKRAALKEWIAGVNKNCALVAMANEAPNNYILRRPTGIIDLDADIGGGFPASGLSVISGPDNSGKTFILLKTMAMHQKLYGSMSVLAFGTAEGAFDYKRALDVGMVIEVPDSMIYEWNMWNASLGIPEYSKEQVDFFKRRVGEFVVLRGNNGEEFMDTVLRAVESKMFGIIGVDSFSVLLPQKDEEKAVGDAPAMAANANLMTDFIRKYTPHTSGLKGNNPTTLIGIMQVRANREKSQAASFMQKYLKDWAVTGAYATKHGKLVDLTVWDGGKIDKTVGGQKTTVGKKMYWKVEKGKAGCHDNVQGEVEFRYDLPGGTNDIGSLIMRGIRQGIFVEERGKVTVYHPITRNKTEHTFPNYQQFGNAMAADFELELIMRTYVLAGSGLQCLYRPLKWG